MRPLSFATLASTLALASSINTRQESSEEPCARVAAQGSNSANKGRFDGSLALECLRSVPLDKENDLNILNTIRSHSQFESNLQYLKYPPPGALYPAVDLLGGLDDIAAKLQDGNHYNNSYDLWSDVRLIAVASHDFHFNIELDIVSIFSWQRDDGLISLSSDGLALPDLYLVSDLNAINSTNAGYTASSVTKINGVDAEIWVNNLGSEEPHGHDPDANYNKVLYNAPSRFHDKGAPNDLFQFTKRPQGSSTEITFANGSTAGVRTYAYSNYNFTGVTDGASFFNHFCKGNLPKTNSTADTQDQASNGKGRAPLDKPDDSMSTWFGPAYAATADLSAVAYLPPDIPDLAVIQLPTFETADLQSFRMVTSKLLAAAQEQGRKRLIVDLRGNGGGRIILGYDLFNQLFPTLTPFGSFNMRSTPLFDELISIIDYNISSSSTNGEEYGFNYGSPFDDKKYFTTGFTNFTSAQAFYGPYQTAGDNFTALSRQLFSFGDNLKPSSQVFNAADILILQDGLCGSTCATFAEFMKSQALVKSIVIGGRRQDGPMQAVGGSKGSEVITQNNVTYAVDYALTAANSSAKDSLNDLIKSAVPGAAQLRIRADDNSGSGLMRVNFKNNIRQNDTTLTPLQYVYEAADCRFFYTPTMIYNQTAVWEMAYNIHWGKQACVAGSADHPSSLSGGLLSYINSYPPAGANYTFGANGTAFPSGINNAASSSSAISSTIAPSTGATVFQVSTTYTGTAPTNTPSGTVSGSGAPSASATGKSSAGRPDALSVGSSFGGLVALVLAFLC